MNIWDADLFERLSAYVASKHRTQFYPNGLQLPYYLHLTQVCSRAVRAAVVDPSLDVNLVMACALLHDVIEDCAPTEADKAEISQFIRQECGETVLNGVLALSKNDIFDVHGHKDKRAMMEDSLTRITAQDKGVWVVKLADRISNLQAPPPHWTREKKERYLEEAILIYDALHTASPLLAKELQDKISAYQVYIEG